MNRLIINKSDNIDYRYEVLKQVGKGAFYFINVLIIKKTKTVF